MRSCSLRYSVIGGYSCWLAPGTGFGKERGILCDKFGKCRDLEFVQNISQLGFCGLEVYIRFESPRKTQPQPRMVRIDFARMNIENYRTIFPQNFTAHLADDGVGKQAQM